MATFVLVHGTWHGGWCWDRVVPLLEVEGDQVFAPSLTGCGELSHLATPEVTLETHANEIAKLMDEHDLMGVVLVGHGYGGMVITAVADLRRRRIGELVYLDGCVPDNGQTTFDVLTPIRGPYRQRAREAGEGWLVPPPEPSALGVTDAVDAAWVASKLTPMPIHTHDEPVLARQGNSRRLPRSFIHCSGATMFNAPARLAKVDGWSTYDIDAGIDVMITEPEGLAAALLDVAGRVVGNK